MKPIGVQLFAGRGPNAFHCCLSRAAGLCATARTCGVFAEPLSLEQQLRALVGAQTSDVGVAAIDLATGETVSINGNTAFPMASTVKVAVAAAYLSQVDHGRRSLDDRISGQSAPA